MKGIARHLPGSVALFLLLLLPAAAADDTRYSVPIGSSPTVGPANAPVVLVEFIDYQ